MPAIFCFFLSLPFLSIEHEVSNGNNGRQSGEKWLCNLRPECSAKSLFWFLSQSASVCLSLLVSSLFFHSPLTVGLLGVFLRIHGYCLINSSAPFA